MHVLEKEITLDAPKAKVWEFLATPLNLNELTPPSLEFKCMKPRHTSQNGTNILLLLNYCDSAV